MTQFDDLIQQHADLAIEKQKEAGKALEGAMDKEHANFLKTLIKMLDAQQIRSDDKNSLLNKEVYDKLPQEWKDKVDLALLNIVQQIRIIEEFYRSKDTPNSSPHLETMIEQLWQMKQRIEATHDVFVF